MANVPDKHTAQGGGGSGESIAEVRVRGQAAGLAAYDASIGAGPGQGPVVDENGNPVYLADNTCNAPTSCGARERWEFGPVVIQATPPTDIGGDLASAGNVVEGAGLAASGAGAAGNALVNAGPSVSQLADSEAVAGASAALGTAGKIAGVGATVLEVGGGAIQFGEGLYSGNSAYLLNGSINLGAAIGGAIIGGPAGFAFGLAIGAAAQ